MAVLSQSILQNPVIKFVLLSVLFLNYCTRCHLFICISIPGAVLCSPGLWQKGGQVDQEGAELAP